MAEYTSSQTSINLPQLLAVALVGFFALRWFMSKPGNASSSSSSPREPSQRRSARGTTVDVSKVDQVSAMFPQLDRRQIAWDLQRNGGSVSATCERLLNGPGGLDVPPPSFQPALPPAPGSGGSGSAGGENGSGQAKQQLPSQPDLITRYNLHAKVSGKGKEPVPSEEQRRNAWSSDKAARAEGLRKRREEMILAARRAMEAKDSGTS